MKKGQIAQGKVTHIIFPNKGVVVTDEQEKVIVKNTVPGQKVSFFVNKVKHGKAEARLLEVLEKSPLEVESPCPHFGECGGCTYQNLPYEEQLALKEAQVKKLMEDAIKDKCEYEFQGIKASPERFEYRNKMEFSFGDAFKDGPLALGMHKRGSFYDIVPVGNCQIIDEDFRLILSSTLDFFTEKHTTFYHRMKGTGYLRHLLVRKAKKTGEILIDLITTTQIDSAYTGVASQEQLLEEYTSMLRALPYKGTLKGVLHTKNDSVADVVKNEGTDILWGEDFFFEELLGLRFRISPFSFFQTNSLGAEVLYTTAREFILNGDENSLNEKTVYDLYSGTGTIAQMMAPVCKEVVGVEIVEEAVEAAKENAKLNGLDNCSFLAGDVLKVLDTIDQKPDYIILDPPRDGIHPKAIEKIINYGVDHMVYISCKPTSLARDLEIFLARGYQVDKICCIDQFPGSVHVETVVLLSQRKADDYVEVELELDELDVTSAESKATYAEIKDYVLKKHGLKVSNLYISQVKRKCGIEVGENYNLPKYVDSRQPQCPAEKEKAIRDALEHFGVV
ncbi:MAG: 23S rRNA (uracil(1939)-C(5))-methyltransferase RlmD [Agathobacter sp.]|nr:23S rRNA (uracil(1939)-C(5))-methyltransferase RlmD [Agathobacter sp.]